MSIYTLRLFHRDNPFQQMEALALGDGNLTIGRDPSAGLAISDPTNEVSRLHCVLAVRGDKLALQDLSSNGVYLGAARERVGTRDLIPLREREAIHIGQFVIVVEATSQDTTTAPPASMGPNLLRPPIMGADAFAIPPDWTSVGCEEETSEVVSKPGIPASIEESTDVDPLVVAFCRGAHLDPAEFANDDPKELMQRVGAMYQQMVLGLGVLMSERTIAKGAYGLDATAAESRDMNPFKWAPTRRAAVDLLRKRSDGILFGSEALKASFVDLRKHLVCMMAGSRAVLAAALKSFSPDVVEKRIEGETFILKSRDAALWHAYSELYTDVRKRALGDPESPINVAFREAYEHQLHDLHELSTLS